MSEICSFYRDSKCIATGKGLGFCDFDDFESICEGDFRFCEKSDDARKYLLDQGEKRRRRKNDGKENQKQEV